VPPEVMERLMRILRYTEANFTTLDLARHDRCAAVISHVPHLAAAALVTLLNRSGDDLDSCLKLIGGGFKDTTRIASSNADMWADICMTNRKPIVDALHEMQAIIRAAAGGLDPRLRQQSHERTPQLPIRAGDENAEALLSICAPGSRKGSLLAPHRRGLVHWPTLPSPWASFCRRLTMLRR